MSNKQSTAVSGNEHTLQLKARKYPVQQKLTQKDRAIYHEYDLSLIEAVLHNWSFAGLNNPHPEVTYSDVCDQVTITRCATEELAIYADFDDQSLVLMVGDPQVGASNDEMTAICLSRREIHVLHSLLNRLVVTC